MTDSPDQPGLGGEAPIRRLSSRVVHDGRVVHLSLDKVRFPDGREGELEIVRHKGAAAIVPLKGRRDDPDPEVVLIRQYRYATGEFVFEVPAGIPEREEPWEDCARRELEEETGFTAERWTYLTRVFTTPGFTNEMVHLFLAEGLRLGEVFRDEDEFMEVVELPLSRVLEMIGSGEIRDGKSLASILFLDRFLRGGR